MANLYLLATVPNGFRLKDIFKTVSGSIIYNAGGGLSTARFSIALDDGTLLPILYRGTTITSEEGDVGFIRAGTEDEPWFFYGDLVGPSLCFSYEDLVSFHQGSEAAAAAIMSGDDTITGYSEHDYLEGYAGDDILNCGTGADTMAGGTGNDTYVIGSTESIIIELDGEGLDTIRATVSYTLPDEAHVEVLNAAEGSIDLVGNSRANTINGSAGNNDLYGRDGDDNLNGEAGSDHLYGEGGDDVVGGGADNDNLDGGAGNDRLYGNDGNDVLSGRDGIDTVYGMTGNDILYGGRDNDQLFGDEGNDTFSGDAGDDFLRGGSDNDVLAGGTGNDMLYGDVGSDSLVGDSGHDSLFGGFDSDVLDGGIDSDSLHGEDGSDHIRGQSGRDTLCGGLGNDVLVGGGDGDVFVFSTKPDHRTNLDRISDFNVKDDTIQLARAVFKGIGKNGKLKKSAFWVGDKAHDPSDRIIYDAKSGAIFYDRDGTGASAQVKIGVTAKKLPLTAADFFIV